MVLATRYKNISKFVKALAVLLSVVLMCGAALCAVHIVASLEYTGNVQKTFGYAVKGDLAECEPLVTTLVDSMDSLGNETIYRDEEGLKKAILSQKEDYLKAMLARFKKEKADCTAALRADDGEVTVSYDENGDPIYETTTTGVIGGDTESFDFSYDFTYSGITFTLSTEEMARQGNGSYNINLLNDDEKTAQQKLEGLLNYYLENKLFLNSMLTDTGTPAESVPADLRYYVKNRKNNIVVSNMTDDEVKHALNQQYALSYINNQVKTSEDWNGVLNNYYSTKEYQWILYDNECDYILFVDTDISAAEAGRHSFQRIMSDYQQVSKYSVKTNLIGGVLMLILSIVLAVWYFIHAGTRDENGNIKLAFIDYVPSDVHLAVTVGLTVLGLYALFLTFDGVGYLVFTYDLEQRLMLWLGLGAVAAIWALIIEAVSSVVRVCKSKRSFFKHLLIFYFLKYGVYIPCRWLLRIAKKGFKKLTKLFTYKPDGFKHTLTRWLILYFGVNFLMFLIMAFAVGDGDYPGVIFGAGFFTLLYNTAMFVYVVWYSVQLDKIITAAHHHTEPQVDDEKLPNSLKVLADSLRVSRDELSVAVAQAVRDERMRADLITNVSHDLKTPLTSIISYVDLLKGCEIDDANAKEYIGVLDEKSGRLKRLIDDLIEASKITSGVISINPVGLSLSELAAQAVYERQQEFTERGLELVFKGDRTNMPCFADGNKTFRVLDNLLSNAKKYSARGTRVYCDVYAAGESSVFEIKNISAAPLDISPEELTERFVRGDKSRTQDGNGLGLSIASSLCDAMHGKLELSIDGDLFKARVLLPKTK